MSYFPGSDGLFLFVYISTFVTGLPLNIAALCTLIKKFRHDVLPVDILLVNLTISDLLLLMFLPFRMLEAVSGMEWNMPYILCPLSAFMYFSSIYITSLFLMAISMERYLAVAFPIKYKLLRKPVYSVLASLFLWVIGSVHCSIVYIVENTIPSNMTEQNNTMCYSTFSPSQLKVLLPVRLEISLLFFFLPFLITVFCYSNFIKIVLFQARLEKKRKMRAIYLVMVTLISFILCFMPYNLSHVVGFFQGSSPQWRVYTLLLSTFNASLDPLIFYFSSFSFKKAFVEGLVDIFKRLQFGNCCYKICIAPCERETKDIRDSTYSLVSNGEHTHVVLAIYILTFMTGLPSNLLAFYAFLVKVRRKPTPVDIFLLNLTISDLLLLIFLPLKMQEAASGMHWNMPIFLCPLTGFCYFSSIYISTLFLTAVSIERYLGVAFPIKYKLHRKPEYAVFASICFWFLACGHCSIVYIVQYSIGNNATASNETRCYEDFSSEQLKVLLPVRLELGLTLFFIPSIITLFCYISFVRILMSLPNIQKKRKQRAIGLAIATLANFCICFAPYNISHIVGFAQNRSPDWRVDALLLSTFNATLDPVVFYFTSTTVQKTFFDFLAVILLKLGRICPCKKLCPPPVDPPYNDSNLDRSST
ncbi:uncharacterized protein ACMZJ9_019001 [Mantella aurantiaca]